MLHKCITAAATPEKPVHCVTVACHLLRQVCRQVQVTAGECEGDVADILGMDGCIHYNDGREVCKMAYIHNFRIIIITNALIHGKGACRITLTFPGIDLHLSMHLSQQKACHFYHVQLLLMSGYAIVLGELCHA